MKLEAVPKKTIAKMVYHRFNHTTAYWKIANVFGLLSLISFIGYCVLKVYYKVKYETIKDFFLSKVLNTPIRMLLVSSLAQSFYAIGCFQVLMNSDFAKKQPAATTFIKALALIGVFFIIMSIRRTLISNRGAKLNSAKTKQLMGNLYLGLRTNDEKALEFTGLFLGRRLLIAPVLMFVPLLPVQIALNQGLSMAIIFYLWEYSPFEDPTEGNIWILNELWLMASTGMLFWFTDAYSPRVRYNYGFIYISLFVLCFALNIRHLVRQKCCKKKSAP